MPDQPDDPLHYEMKVPPEPKDAPLNKEEQRSGSDESANKSETLKRPEKKESDSNPSQPSGQ